MKNKFRTNSTELNQKDKKVIRDFVILLLFGLVLLDITYLIGNSFAVAPDQRREQTICINQQDKKVSFSVRFLITMSYEKQLTAQ